MGIMPDTWIRTQAMMGMIEPFEEKLAQKGVISYGLSSYGYDARVGRQFKIFTNINSSMVDPKNFTDDAFVEHEGDSCIIPPNSFALAHTVEVFRIPREVLTLCVGKSTYARCGIIVNVTPLEPEWEGTVTLELSNTTPLPAKVYANEGICQFMFFKGESVCETSYKDRGGKYQGQRGITLPKIFEEKKEKEILKSGMRYECNSLDGLWEMMGRMEAGASLVVPFSLWECSKLIQNYLGKGTFSVHPDNITDRVIIKRFR